MSAAALMGSDLYLRHRDKKGAEWVQHHRVWDAERAYTSQRDAARKENGDVELATESDYIESRRARS